MGAGPSALPATALRERIGARGPVDFAAFMETVLYGEGGFYSTHPGRAGRRGDFVTSPELGGLFARCVARAVAAWAARAGIQGPVRVADAGGGRGTLAAALAESWPGPDGVEVAVVDRSPAALTEAATAALAGAETLADLPLAPHAVVANELLDNLPARLLQGGDTEVCVGLDGDDLGLFHVPADTELRAFAARWWPATGGGATVPGPVPVGARAWLDTVASPYVLLFDYGDDFADLVHRPDWPVRAYAGQREVDPLGAPGDADVTCDVPVDVVAALLEERGYRVERATQRDWLLAHGIEDDAAAARAAERDAAARQDHMAQLVAKGAPHEARTLTDPSAMGAFWVLEAVRE